MSEAPWSPTTLLQVQVENRLGALHQLITILFAAVGSASPQMREQLLSAMKASRAAAEEAVLPGIPAEQAMLHAGELEDAIDWAFRPIARILGAKDATPPEMDLR